MNRQTMLTFIVFTVVCLGASLFATQQVIARKRIEHENAILQGEAVTQRKAQEEAAARIATLQQNVEQASSEAMTLRQQIAAQAQKSFRTSCIDSDARLGTDAVFVRGYVQTENSRTYDSCRENQLLEQVCIENPRGSGHWIPDYNWITCPHGARCVNGECLR